MYTLNITKKNGSQVAYSNLTKARRYAKTYAKRHYRDVTICEEFRGHIVAQYDRHGDKIL